mmetsp:Transcript_20805/g.34019  ORF Transcript_20805/g.34019 Transcript_20805/m.34019 type:complete len:84 (+) Transcript_20805:578-829(+)
MKPVTSRDDKSVIVELEDETSDATALEMAAKVDAEESFEFIPETITALSAPGGRCIVIVYETTPVLSMSVTVTKAPAGKAPSA